MARFRLVLNGLYFSIISAILICASAEESRNRTRFRSTTTTSLPLSSSPASTTTSTTTPVPDPTTTEHAQASTTSTSSAILTAAPSAPVTNVEVPPTLTDFIITMMKRFGAAKAVEAFQSLDQLPLGLIMKILLVEMDKQLAADIVSMQRYAQSTDKALILMIGRIVGGDKNVPKEIFTMDQKLMKFGWWMRIRQRMFNNLEKYVAAYSLVPVAVKSAISGGSSGTDGAARSNSRSKLLNTGLESFIQGPQPDLAVAVAASATESYSSVGSTSASKTILQEAPVPDSASAASAPAPTSPPVRVSLLNPIQQQQIFETLALAQAAAGTNSQVQQLLQLQQLQQLQQQQQQQQQQQATNINPFIQLFGR